MTLLKYVFLNNTNAITKTGANIAECHEKPDGKYSQLLIKEAFFTRCKVSTKIKRFKSIPAK